MIRQHCHTQKAQLQMAHCTCDRLSFPHEHWPLWWRGQKYSTQWDARLETAPNIWESVMSYGSAGYTASLWLLRPYKVYHEFPSPKSMGEMGRFMDISLGCQPVSLNALSNATGVHFRVNQVNIYGNSFRRKYVFSSGGTLVIFQPTADESLVIIYPTATQLRRWKRDFPQLHAIFCSHPRIAKQSFALQSN